MTSEQAGWTSFREYRMLADGEKEKSRERWEIARWQMFLMMQMHPNIKKHEKPARPQDWIRFPWEQDRHIGIRKSDVLVTEKETEQLMKMLSVFKQSKERS